MSGETGSLLPFERQFHLAHPSASWWCRPQPQTSAWVSSPEFLLVTFPEPTMTRADACWPMTVSCTLTPLAALPCA